jgi:ABC-2 type transport system ATP-binding protein
MAVTDGVWRAPQAAKRTIGLAIDPSSLPALLSGRECLALFAEACGV